jgi:hypothetical protein
MADENQTEKPQYLYSDLTLNAKPSPDGNTLDFYVLLNGVEVPIQRLFVHDFREKFEEAASKAGDSSEEQPQ